jgi:hypothetical protein
MHRVHHSTEEKGGGFVMKRRANGLFAKFPEDHGLAHYVSVHHGSGWKM